jgi:dCTP deaminase
MSTLVDFQIITCCEDGMVKPFHRHLVNPASYDVTLGGELLIESPPSEDGTRRWVSVDISKKSYILMPGAFVLGCTEQVIKLPDTIEAVFCLKSSRGREGFDHALAAYIDPGYRGKITLEIKNGNNYNNLELYQGLRIGQLRFAKLSSPPNASYLKTGRYNYDNKPYPSRG